MKLRSLFLFAFGLLMIAAPAFADTTGYDLGSIMDKYQTAATQFGLNITSVALKLCYTLFTIDLVWTVLGRLLKGSDAVEIGTTLFGQFGEQHRASRLAHQRVSGSRRKCHR